MKRRLPPAERKKRNDTIVRAYLDEGLSQAELAERFNVARSQISIILRDRGVRKDHREIHRANALKRWQEGVYERAGRTPVWPDCPDHIKPHYRRFRRQYGYTAEQARAVLEAEL